MSARSGFAMSISARSVRDSGLTTRVVRVTVAGYSRPESAGTRTTTGEPGDACSAEDSGTSTNTRTTSTRATVNSGGACGPTDWVKVRVLTLRAVTIPGNGAVSCV